MKVNKNMASSMLIPLIIISILGLAGLLNFTINVVTGAECVCVGIYLVYKYMRTEKEGILFTGSSLFLAGLLLFFMNYYYFPKPLDLVFSALPFVISVNFLLLYINKPRDISSVYLACVFFVAGWFIAAHFGSLSLRSVFYDIINIIKHYWIIIILIIIQLYYLIKNS